MRFSAIIALLSVLLGQSGCKKPVNRFDLVTRHNITNSIVDSLNSLSLGNGEFCFTADITGLQTFPEEYMRGVPLGTMSNWGWYTAPNPDGYRLEDVKRSYNVHGRNVDYVHQFSPADDVNKAMASEWLRANQLRIHLGLIGLRILKDDGSEVKIEDITGNSQTLDLWKGELASSFTVDGRVVTVKTVCHPERDMISAEIRSELIRENRLGVKIDFPFTNPVSFGFRLSPDGDHSTRVIADREDYTLFERVLNNEIYYVGIRHDNSVCSAVGDNSFTIDPDNGSDSFTISCIFSEVADDEPLPGFAETSAASAESWENFWNSGGAVDFSECTDPRAPELERRVVLSQYLTKIQCSGSLPPAETGLTYNSWYGKFHLEMHWWHAVHFALWGREEILEKQMDYYRAIFREAEATAAMQGYKGVRWPKMTDPSGRESPSTVGTYLIWQQPHPVFYAELLYVNSKNKEEVLQKYREIVFATADFMASYAWYDKEADRYILGPVLIPAQESLPKETTINPVFELAYWYWGLSTAAEWRERCGLDENELWTDILTKLSPLPVQNGIYLCAESATDSYTNPRYMSDHPIVSGVLGVLPETKMVDKQILRRSLDTISVKWNWPSTWGWDFPMLAMSSASVGESGKAIDFLLMDAPKNRYLLNGHNYQSARLSLYLPGNGGLLAAVAKMCTEGQFPDNGKWKVRWEGLNTYVR